MKGPLRLSACGWRRVLLLDFPICLLRWSQSGNLSGYAITDGFLYFPDPTDLADVYAQLEVGIGHEAAKCILLLAENRSSLATFEFLAADSPEVILAIPNCSNLPRFEWTNCNAPDSAALTKHEKQRKKVQATEQNIGHDAKTAPWTLHQHPNNPVHMQSSSENKKRKRDESDDQNKARLLLSIKKSYS